MVDENWTVGKIPSGSVLQVGKDFIGEVKGLEVFPRAMCPKEIIDRCGGEEQTKKRTLEILGAERESMQYWTPRGHNQWMGDVMFGDLRSFEPERIHLYYLIDRRHGSSKFSSGGHFIAHMSSSDLVHWEHHPLALELDEWNTIATGRPFVCDGKIIMAHGYHTDRIFPSADVFTIKPDEKGDYSPRVFPTAGKFLNGDPEKGKYPMGSTFAESTDGIHFQKANVLMHECQNPSIVPEEGGNGYLMLAGYGVLGLWRSDDLFHWTEIDHNILPYWQPPLHCSEECQCYFEWNGWHYIVAGRTGFWMSKKQTGPYWEGKDGKNTGVITPRWNLNEGLWVPMVAEFKNNRRILAGFLTGPDFEWGGYLVFRELIQMADGSLGLKWPDEMRPAMRGRVELKIRVGNRISQDTSIEIHAGSENRATLENMQQCLHLSARITPGQGTSHIAIAGLGENGEGCSLSFLLKRARAQWSTAKKNQLPGEIPSLEEIRTWSSNFVHFKGMDFTTTNVEG